MIYTATTASTSGGVRLPPFAKGTVHTRKEYSGFLFADPQSQPPACQGCAPGAAYVTEATLLSASLSRGSFWTQAFSSGLARTHALPSAFEELGNQGGYSGLKTAGLLAVALGGIGITAAVLHQQTQTATVDIDAEDLDVGGVQRADQAATLEPDVRVVSPQRRQTLDAQRIELEARMAALEAQLGEADVALLDKQAQIEAEQGDKLGGLTLDDASVLDAARQAEARAKVHMAMLYEQVMPVVLQGKRAQEIVDKRVAAVQTRVPDIIQEEVNSSVEEVKQMVSKSLPMFNFGDAASIPQLTWVIAGLAAPIQLNMLHGENLARLGVSGALLVVDLLVLGLGYHGQCMTESFLWFGDTDVLHRWLGTDAAILTFTCGVGVSAFMSCSQTLADIQAAHERETEDLPDDPDAAFRARMESNLLTGARAMLAYDRITQGPAFKTLPYLNMFDFVWQICGWFLFFDTPRVHCADSLTLLYWSRGRGMIFLLGFIVQVLGLGCTIAKAAIQHPAFGAAVLSAAKVADEAAFPDGPPAATLLVRSLLVRDTTDMHGMELKLYQAEAIRITSVRNSIKSEFARVDKQLKALEHTVEKHEAGLEAQRQVVQEDAAKQEFVQRYKIAMDDVSAAAQGAQEFVSQAGNIQVDASGILDRATSAADYQAGRSSAAGSSALASATGAAEWVADSVATSSTGVLTRPATVLEGLTPVQAEAVEAVPALASAVVEPLPTVLEETNREETGGTGESGSGVASSAAGPIGGTLATPSVEPADDQDEYV